MGEISQEVKTYNIHYLCDKCGKGEMLSTGITLTTMPPQYPHKCTACDNTDTFFKRYPYKSYEIIP